MTSYTFYNPEDGRTFFVRGPSTLTSEQAQRIFNEQKNAGALIGLKSGDLITPEFQLANGLTTAEASVLTDLKNNAQTIASGFVFPQVPVTNGITVASYAKQPSANDSIEKISRAEVTGVLAQVKNLTQQESTEATNLGAGKYALTVQQLERTGYIKPGTAATYLNQSTISMLGVLTKTNVWTGKDGVSNLAQLLQNESLQDNIQQTLMSSGLSQIAEVGVDVDAQPAQRQAGLALLAAINPDLAASWVNGKAPALIQTNGPLPTDTPSDWQNPDRIVRDAAYATEFSASKVNNAMRTETEARGYINVTQRQVLDFATNQIVGNKKVPTITYGSDPVDSGLLEEYNILHARYVSIESRVTSVLNLEVTLANAVGEESRLTALKKEISSIATNSSNPAPIVARLANAATNQTEVGLQADVRDLIRRAEISAPVSPSFLADLDSLSSEIAALIAKINKRLQFISRVLGRNVVIQSTGNLGVPGVI